MPLSDNRLTERIQAAIRAAVRQAGSTRLLVACSGGGDSVCLAHATVMVARKEGRDIALGHVRHGLRADDGDDAALVAQLAHDLDVPIFTHRHQPGRGAADEATLRQTRYAALAVMATRFHADAVLTGHTQDDQAETLFLHLVRGAGVDGLAGIAPDAPLPICGATAIRALRPLLAISRQETHAYCLAHALAYRDDPTNMDTRYARNWMRHMLLPLLVTRYPGAVPTLARTADLLRDDAVFLRALTDAALARCTVRTDAANVTVLDRRTLIMEPVALQRRMLRALVAAYSGRVPRADRLEIARRTLTEENTTRISRLEDVAFWPAYDQITVGREADVVATVRRRALQRHPLTRYAHATPFVSEAIFVTDDPLSRRGAVKFRLAVVPLKEYAREMAGVTLLRLPETPSLALRNRTPGDLLHPVGGAGSRTLRDYLTRQGVPAPLRDELPLLVLNDEPDRIVAVIGYDIAVAFSATVETATHVLSLRRTARR